MLAQDPPAGIDGAPAAQRPRLAERRAARRRRPGAGRRDRAGRAAAAAQDGLELAAVSEIRSDAYPSDVVVAQDPAAKTAAAPASRCS